MVSQNLVKDECSEARRGRQPRQQGLRNAGEYDPVGHDSWLRGHCWSWLSM